MKMVKKILLGLALAGTVLALAGCSMGDDENMKDSGNKWEKKAEIDHKTKYADKDDMLYRRAWTQLGDKETVTKIKTKLVAYTSDIEATVYESSKNTANTNPNEKLYSISEATGESATRRAVVGFMFDVHEYEKTIKVNGKDTKTKYYEFVIIGYRPSDDKYYVEHYKDVPKGAFDGATSSGDLFEGGDANVKKLNGTEKYDSNGAYLATPISSSFISTDTEKKTKSFDITVTQSALTSGKGTYSIKIGNKTFTYTRDATEAELKKGALMGGAAIYANAPLGTIAKLEAKSDKDATEGLFEEVEE